MVMAQIAFMNCELGGMSAENAIRAMRGEAPAYNEDAFYDVYRRYDPVIGFNAIVALRVGGE